MRLALFTLAMICVASSLAGTEQDAYLKARLADVRAAYPVPALTAAVWTSGQIGAKAVVGVRKQGTLTSSQLYDRFHIGSITKPVTSSLVARLIDLGIVPSYGLNLNTTHPWVFQSPYGGQTQYKTAALLSYLSHVDGMHYQPLNEPADEYASYGVTNLITRRKMYVKDAVRDVPYGPVGTKRVYAGGHIVAASMLEQLTGKRWEDLVDQYVFTPLGMSSAGFGPMSSTSSTTGTYEHSWNGSAAVPRVWPANYAYEPHAPAGRNVSCSITDLVKFGASHLNSTAGSTRILSETSINTLRTVHYPNATNLEGNLSVMTPAWLLSSRTINNATYQGYWHNGDNGFNYAWLEVVPGANLSFAIATNLTNLTAGSPAGPAIDSMKKHCIDIQEHFNAINLISRDFVPLGSLAFGSGSLGSLANLADHNFSTQTTFYSAGSAARINFTTAKTARRFHLSNEDAKIRGYKVEMFKEGNPVSGWVTIYTGGTPPRDGSIVIPSQTGKQFRLTITQATSWPVKVEEFWLMAY